MVLSILFSNNSHEVLNLFEIGSYRKGEKIMGIKVMPIPPLLTQFQSIEHLDLFFAIGCNQTRMKFWKMARREDLQTPNLISSQAIVDQSAEIGEANVICSSAFIGPCAKIGDNNLINTGAIVEHEAKIGNHSHMAPRSLLGGRSTIHDLCFIGAGATIIDGLIVVSHTTLGAGSTLIKNVSESNQTLVGVPSRSIPKK